MLKSYKPVTIHWNSPFLEFFVLIPLSSMYLVCPVTKAAHDTLVSALNNYSTILTEMSLFTSCLISSIYYSFYVELSEIAVERSHCSAANESKKDTHLTLAEHRADWRGPQPRPGAEPGKGTGRGDMGSDGCRGVSHRFRGLFFLLCSPESIPFFFLLWSTPQYTTLHNPVFYLLFSFPLSPCP